MQVSVVKDPAQTTMMDMPGLPANSGWLCVDQDRITGFANVTGDQYFIHTSPERAALETPFGGTIAHGLLTLSLIPLLWDEVCPSMPDVALSVNYGFDRVRFIAPVRCNDRVRGHFALREMRMRKPGEYLVSYDVTIEIEGAARPALTAQWQVLYFLHKETK